MTKPSHPKTERFIATAKRQFRRSCIPTATAVLVSVGISKLGIPAIPLIAVGAVGIALHKGYRLRINVVRPGTPDKSSHATHSTHLNTGEDHEDDHTERPTEGGRTGD